MRAIPLLCVVLGLASCTPAPTPLLPSPTREPAGAPPEPPAIRPTEAAPASRGALRGRDIASGARQDSVILADQRRQQQDLAAAGQQWIVLDSLATDYEVLYRWREIRSGIPLGARMDLASVAWPREASVTSISDTVITMRVAALGTNELGRMEWRGESGRIRLTMELRPGRNAEWVRVRLVPFGAEGQVSDRFRDRLRSIAVQMPLILNAWVLRSRTQTILDGP